MALATKCPHCNTIFRVAHDQLKLRGGIVRCGACNEVFDGNAALLEPPAKPPAPVAAAALSAAPPAAPALSPAPLPEPTPFDAKMAALDTRAAEVLGSDAAEPIYTLELDTAMDAAEAGVSAGQPAADAHAADAAPVAPAAADAEAAPEPDAVDNFDDAPGAAPAPFALPAEPALPAAQDAPLDLDLDVEPAPGPEAASGQEPATQQPEHEPAPAAAAVDDAPFEDALSIEAMSDEELEAALETELAAMEQSSVPEREPENEEEPSADFFADMLANNGRREPTLDEAPAAADLASAQRDGADGNAAAPATHTMDIDDADEEALVQLSSAGMAEAQSARAHAHLHAAADAIDAAGAGDMTGDDAAADGKEDGTADSTAEGTEEDTDEPGFVKRDRRRQKFGKAATVAMSLGSVLLLAALAGQGLTTFRNQIAAAMPPLKPALLAACGALGCKIALPAQIDDLTIEQGELQTLTETTFSFTTLLRNQSATAQAWPHIELVLDDAADKHILRRVFAPRDYLGADVALDKGFAPHTEQSVKLYFELNELKASGYHIAVFYP